MRTKAVAATAGTIVCLAAAGLGLGLSLGSSPGSPTVVSAAGSTAGAPAPTTSTTAVEPAGAPTTASTPGTVLHAASTPSSPTTQSAQAAATTPIAAASPTTVQTVPVPQFQTPAQSNAPALLYVPAQGDRPAWCETQPQWLASTYTSSIAGSQIVASCPDVARSMVCSIGVANGSVELQPAAVPDGYQMCFFAAGDTGWTVTGPDVFLYRPVTVDLTAGSSVATIDGAGSFVPQDVGDALVGYPSPNSAFPACDPSKPPCETITGVTDPTHVTLALPAAGTATGVAAAVRVPIHFTGSTVESVTGGVAVLSLPAPANAPNAFYSSQVSIAP